jgi:peptidoglycan/LPS O-acetylase OafA/YrhL
VPPERSALIGGAIAGVCGLLLILSLFLTWYEVPLADPASDILDEFGGEVLGLDVKEKLARTGWEAFEVLDVICVIAGGVALARAGVAILGDDPNPSIPGSILTLALGAVALAFVLYRVVNPPGIGLNRELGLWVGAFAAGGIVYGSFLAMQAGRSASGDRSPL